MQDKYYNEKKSGEYSLINKNHFEFCHVIGKGGFGKVWKVEYKKTKATYALKEMSKLKILDKKSEKSINSEREFLSILHHPFIVNMHYAFQDNDNLYLVMDMLSGGDLRYHIARHKKFSEEQTRFFIACMVHSLEYIHRNNVIHRDIKPENLVLDDKGYVRITDFGIAKENMKDNASETSGTPGYMAPEVMRGKNHSFAVDFFAIGVIGYEFMTGRRPYYGKNRNEIKQHMMSTQAMIKEDSIPDGWSTESVDFINRLLQRKEENRLGINGAKELKEHPWMKYYPWKDIEAKKLRSPFIPDTKDNFDKYYCRSLEKITEQTQMRYNHIIMKEKYRTAFEHFIFNKDEIQQQHQISTKECSVNNNLTTNRSSSTRSLANEGNGHNVNVYRHSSLNSSDISQGMNMIYEPQKEVTNDISSKCNSARFLSSSRSTRSLLSNNQQSKKGQYKKDLNDILKQSFCNAQSAVLSKHNSLNDLLLKPTNMTHLPQAQGQNNHKKIPYNHMRSMNGSKNKDTYLLSSSRSSQMSRAQSKDKLTTKNTQSNYKKLCRVNSMTKMSSPSSQYILEKIKSMSVFYTMKKQIMLNKKKS